MHMLVKRKVGRGRKECVCGEIIGSLLKKCPICGSTEFKSSQKSTTVKTYDKLKGGRKQCPECNAIIGAKSLKCVCGNTEFVRSQQTREKVIKTYDEPSKGRKTCPECKAIIGGRASKCVCGNTEFGPTGNLTTKQTEDVNKQMASESHSKRFFKGIIVAPIGECPVKLDSTDREKVEDWAYDVYNAGRASGKKFTDEAIIYFVRTFFDIFSTEYKTVVGHLRQMFTPSHSV